MNKKTVLRNIALAVLLVVSSLGVTLAFLAYIQFFRLMPR